MYAKENVVDAESSISSTILAGKENPKIVETDNKNREDLSYLVAESMCFSTDKSLDTTEKGFQRFLKLLGLFSVLRSRFERSLGAKWRSRCSPRRS